MRSRSAPQSSSRPLGPRPDSGQARDVWDRAALAIGKHRVERGITHPYQHGVDTGDWRSRKLGRDLDRLIERLNRHWTARGCSSRSRRSEGPAKTRTAVWGWSEPDPEVDANRGDDVAVITTVVTARLSSNER